jgi:UDP-N-acetylmuramate dehydrogenase
MVNLGGAKASDVVELMALARRKVKEKFNILLEPEINFLGEFDDQISN